MKVPKYLKLDTTSTESLFAVTGTKAWLVFLASSTHSFFLRSFLATKLSLHDLFNNETCQNCFAKESSAYELCMANLNNIRACHTKFIRRRFLGETITKEYYYGHITTISDLYLLWILFPLIERVKRERSERKKNCQGVFCLESHVCQLTPLDDHDPSCNYCELCFLPRFLDVRSKRY